jgi:hypothetical protein
VPEQREVIYFILQSHQLDHVPLTGEEITRTLKKEILNPYAEGHFKAVNYLLTQLVHSPDFPAKHPSNITNTFRTDEALFWLKELHSLCMQPVALFGEKTSNPLILKRYEVGTWRTKPKALAFNYAPAPEQILPILQHWLVELATFHLDIKDRLHNPYGLTAAEGNKLHAILRELPMFISCLQPFEDASNRIARLLENTLRLHWNLPWQQPAVGRDHEMFVRELAKYQDQEFPAWLKKAEVS